MEISFKRFRKRYYTKIEHWSLPAKPGTALSTKLRNEIGQPVPLDVYTGGNMKRNPFLLKDYIKRGYKFSEERKAEINSPKTKKLSPWERMPADVQEIHSFWNAEKLVNSLFK